MFYMNKQIIVIQSVHINLQKLNQVVSPHLKLKNWQKEPGKKCEKVLKNEHNNITLI